MNKNCQMESIYDFKIRENIKTYTNQYLKNCDKILGYHSKLKIAHIIYKNPELQINKLKEKIQKLEDDKKWLISKIDSCKKSYEAILQ